MRGKPLNHDDILNLEKKMARENKPFSIKEKLENKKVDPDKTHGAGTLLPREKNYGVRV